jgi:hypothetical protein
MLPIVVCNEEYFYFIISFYAYLFVTLQSQMKNRFLEIKNSLKK